jgi:hypothetical protein
VLIAIDIGFSAAMKVNGGSLITPTRSCYDPCLRSDPSRRRSHLGRDHSYPQFTRPDIIIIIGAVISRFAGFGTAEAPPRPGGVPSSSRLWWGTVAETGLQPLARAPA